MSEAHGSCNRCTSGMMRYKDLTRNTAGVCDVHQDFKKKQKVSFLLVTQHVWGNCQSWQNKRRREKGEVSINPQFWRTEFWILTAKEVTVERGAIENSLSYVHLWNSCILWWVLESMFVEDKRGLVVLWQVTLTHQHEFGHAFLFFIFLDVLNET